MQRKGWQTEGVGLVGAEPEEEVEKPKHWQHISFRDLPHWMQDNEFLKNNHRPELRSFGECFRSILGLHTETGNIWSHLLGCLFFLLIALRFFNLPSHVFLGHEYGQKIVFSLFFLGAVFCLSLSAAYHTMNCHSQSVNRVFHKLDYVGISLLIVGSYIPWIYYGFYCHQTARRGYLATISLLCITTIIVTMAERFATPRYRPVRALLYVCLGCFGVIPMLHFGLTWGWEAAALELRPDLVVPMGGLYIGGALLYAARIPERLAPGKFDLFGQSHQIFHILVVAAALVHLWAVYEMADFRFSPDGICIS